MWGGNPVSFIKDLNVAETWSNYTYSYLNNFLGDVHKNEFKKTPFPRSYESVKTLAKYRGNFVGKRYAEAFEVFRILK